MRQLYCTGADFDNAARLNAVLPVGDHQLAGLDALVDDGRFLARNPDLEGVLLDLAIVSGPSPGARGRLVNTPELREMRHALVLYVFSL